MSYRFVLYRKKTTTPTVFDFVFNILDRVMESMLTIINKVIDIIFHKHVTEKDVYGMRKFKLLPAYRNMSIMIISLKPTNKCSQMM